MRVQDIGIDKLDQAGVPIIRVYAKRGDAYAVYGTADRVAIQYSDVPELQEMQRSAIAKLNPVRGDINGLIDRWRKGTKARKSAAEQFDRRIADALIIALEGDQDGAANVLAVIKKDVLDERVTWARAEYLMMAVAIVTGVSIVFWFSTCRGFDVATCAFPSTASKLWLAADIGAIGAFFSITLALRERTVLPDLRFWDNTVDVALRLMIGAIAAGVLVALVLASAVELTIGGAKLMSGTPPKVSLLYILIIGFLGGFSERLVPDLLAKAATTPKTTPATSSTTPGTTTTPPAPAGTLPAASGAATAAAAATTMAAMTADTAGIVDHCLADHAPLPSEITPDTELPSATGGVAAMRAT